MTEMKLTKRILCGFLAALTLASVALANDIRVAASLGSVNSVASAVNAVRDQLDLIAASGMLDASEGSRVATQSAEMAIYCAASAPKSEESALRIDRAAVSELAQKAAETRESLRREISERGVETLYNLPIAVRFPTPADVSVTLDPNLSGLDIPVELIVLDTAYYQLKIRLSELIGNLWEPFVITLRDVDEATVKIEVTLSNDDFAKYLTLCFDNSDPDLLNAAFVMEQDGNLVFNRYRYNDITGSIEGRFNTSGVYAAPKKGNFPEIVEFVDMLKDNVSASIRRAVQKAQLQGAVSGYEDYSFRPENPVSRRAFAKMLMELLQETDRTLNVTLNDVKRSDSFYAYVATVLRKGYMTGYDQSTFGAADPLTRQQECAIIGRILEKGGYMNTMTEQKIAAQIRRYADGNQIGDYAKPYVALLTERNIIKPDANGRFNASHNMNRGETIELLCAMLDMPF